jgi:hypothetical protein
MDDVVYEHLLDDGSFFAPRDGHRVIDISGIGSEQPQVNDTLIQERRLSSWWTSPDTGVGPSFRLLIASPRVLDSNIWPLPLSSSTLRELLGSTEIPSLFPRAVCHHIPIATSFENLDGDAKFGLLLRTNLSWTWQYALAMVHDPQEKSTRAILLGLRNNEVDEVLQSVRRSLQFMSCPATLPCILVDKALDALVKDAEDRRKSLIQICYDTGLHGFHRKSFMGQWDDRDDVDLDVLMEKLTRLSDACAGISAVCHMQYTFVDVISAFRKKWDPEGSEKATRNAKQLLCFFGQFLHGIESKVLYTKNSVKGQVQTIYTLISQRDSQSHIMMAAASRRLAELSRKDSTDMRIIAAVTLVFLPATFTATLFSSSFFNFQPPTSDRVSSWIWLYWTITAALTAVVLGGWWHLSRHQQRKALAASLRENQLKERALKERQSTLAIPLEPSARVQALRPYLSGSIAEGVYAKKCKSS